MKPILIIFFIFLFSLKIFGQTPIPEGGFENWTQQTSYEEPSGNWWTSLNSLKSLGGPVTVTKVTDSHNGTYAAKLETKMWGTFILPGLLISGNFVTQPPFVIQGKPFTDKPFKFKGYYKYISVNGDSAAIFAMLTRHNSISGKRDTIATAKKAVTVTTSVYTLFDIEFNYTSAETPDSIDVVFSSSADGANFSGQIGSTLTIDEIMLEYSSGISELLTPEIPITLYPNPTAQTITISVDDKSSNDLTYTVYNLSGNTVKVGDLRNISPIDVSEYDPGIYMINIYRGEKLTGSKKFTIIK